MKDTLLLYLLVCSILEPRTLIHTLYILEELVLEMEDSWCMMDGVEIHARRGRF